MIEFRVLGALHLRTSDGVELRSILAQPKRVALLAYLAVHSPVGLRRRDTLLALLWPESDTEHARVALRKALHFLRRALGEGVIVTRADEEVGIDAERLRCDAAEFIRLLEAGEHAQALELYRGDLLEGFFLSGAPAFENWLEEERARLREQAVRAAWKLAAEAEAADDAERAVWLARRAVVLAQHEEAAERKLIALLGRVGDREAALRTYAELQSRLAREYGVEPSEETHALVEALRATTLRPAPQTVTPPLRAAPPPPAAPGSDDARRASPLSDAGARKSGSEIRRDSGVEPYDPAPRAEANADAPPLAGSHSTPSPSPSSHRSRWRAAVRAPSRSGWLVLLLVIATLLGGAAALSHLRSTPSAPLSSNTVAVLPFAYHGSGESAYLSEGIVRLLSTNLNGAGELRSVDPRALLSVLGERGLEGTDPERGRAVAERFGAGTYVLGHIVEAGGRLRITAVVYERSGATPIEEVTVEGSSAQLLELVDQLTARLLAGHSAEPRERLRRLAGHSAEPRERLRRLAALTTHSLPALKAYLEGEREYHAGRYTAAVEAFQRAVEADTSFALAYYRLSSAAHWGMSLLSPPAAERALQLSARLSRRDRLLVEAWHLYTSPVPAEAERLYRTVLAEHPDDVEAWFQLGEVLFHWGPSYGKPATEAREAFERVVSYEPHNAGALIHLARIAGIEGREAELDSLVRRIIALGPADDQALDAEALRAAALADRSAWQAVVDRVPSLSDRLLTRLVNTVAVSSGDLASAVVLAKSLNVAGREPLARARGQFTLARLELARCRWHAAKAELATLEQQYDQFLPMWTAEYRAALATFPFLRLSRAELEAIRSEIARAPAVLRELPPERIPPTGYIAPGIYAPRRLYLLGLLSVRLGDPRAALDLAGQLEGIVGGDFDSAFGREFARILRGQVAWLQGEPHEVLRLLGEPRVLPDSALPRPEGGYPQADERWLRAELLRELGREGEALRWYATFPDPQGYDLIYLAPSHLRRAEIHERRGEREKAIEHYRRFVELWQDADPELQPLVRQARGRLEGLQKR